MSFEIDTKHASKSEWWHIGTSHTKKPNSAMQKIDDKGDVENAE
jgi:hypothetical protein